MSFLYRFNMWHVIQHRDCAPKLSKNNITHSLPPANSKEPRALQRLVQLCGNALSISVQLRAHIALDASLAPNHCPESCCDGGGSSPSSPYRQPEGQLELGKSGTETTLGSSSDWVRVVQQCGRPAPLYSSRQVETVASRGENFRGTTFSCHFDARPSKLCELWQHQEHWRDESRHVCNAPKQQFLHNPKLCNPKHKSHPTLLSDNASSKPKSKE